MFWCAGFNIPGYLPNNTEEFDNFEDAKQYLIDEIAREKESDLSSGPEYEISNGAISDEINSWRKKDFNETSLILNGYVYFIYEI